MANTSKIPAERESTKWIVVAVSTTIIIALLAAFAFFATPEVFKPDKVTVSGAISAPSVTPIEIVFINNGCGTRSEAEIISGKYIVTLENGYSYNVSLTLRNPSGVQIEAQIATFSVDISNETLVRNWEFQPEID
jgi:hypothetical protein